MVSWSLCFKKKTPFWESQFTIFAAKVRMQRYWWWNFTDIKCHLWLSACLTLSLFFLSNTRLCKLGLSLSHFCNHIEVWKYVAFMCLWLLFMSCLKWICEIGAHLFPELIPIFLYDFLGCQLKLFITSLVIDLPQRPSLLSTVSLHGVPYPLSNTTISVQFLLDSMISKYLTS